METAISLYEQNGAAHGKANMLLWRDSVEEGNKILKTHVKTIEGIKSETYEHLVSMRKALESARPGSELAQMFIDA